MKYKKVLTTLIENFKKPIIAAVNGYALDYAIEAITISKGLDRTLEDCLHLEAKLFGQACAAEDSKERTGLPGDTKANFRGK